MVKAERYEFYSGAVCGMNHQEDGRFVMYSDYAALEAERDRMRELVNKLVDVKSEPDKLLCLLEREARKAKEG